MFHGDIVYRGRMFGGFISGLCMLGILLSWAVNGPGKNPHVLDVLIGIWMTAYLARTVFVYPEVAREIASYTIAVPEDDTGCEEKCGCGV